MSDALIELSDAIAARVRHASPMVVGLDWGTSQLLSALLWSDGVVVTSEQSLPEMDAYQAVLPGGHRVPAMSAGRDVTTNVAVLRLDAVAATRAPGSELDVGGMLVALGSDGEGGTSASLGMVERLGPAWQSQCGGRIDRLVRLDIRLPLSAEGGPVIDSRGRLVGMSTFGPRDTVLVIPTTTIERSVGQLLTHGHVPRGWLGIGVQPVQLPRDIAVGEAHGSGLMVLSIAEGAPTWGALLPGDILLSAGDIHLVSPRALTSMLGAETIGAQLSLRLLRSGAVVEATVTIAARPA